MLKKTAERDLPSPSLVIIGDVAYDCTNVGGEVEERLGGGGYNCAQAASLANGNVGLVSRVGSDFDTQALLASVRTEGLCCTPDPTLRFEFEVDADGRRKLTSRVKPPEFVDVSLFPSHFFGASLVHLATSHPEKYLVWLKYLRMWEKANLRRLIFSVDAFEVFCKDQPELTLDAMRAADIIFANEEELEILGLDNVLGLGKVLIAKYGAKGAKIFIHSMEIHESTAPKVEVVDTTGAGDVLAGVFLGLLSRCDLDSIRINQLTQALDLAVSIASLSVTGRGIGHLIPAKGVMGGIHSQARLTASY